MPGASEPAVAWGGASALQNGRAEDAADTALLPPTSVPNVHLRLHTGEPGDCQEGRPSPSRGEASPSPGLFSVQTTESSSEISIGLALYTSSTVFNSGMSLFAKLLGEP